MALHHHTPAQRKTILASGGGSGATKKPTKKASMKAPTKSKQKMGKRRPGY